MDEFVINPIDVATPQAFALDVEVDEDPWWMSDQRLLKDVGGAWIYALQRLHNLDPFIDGEQVEAWQAVESDEWTGSGLLQRLMDDGQFSAASILLRELDDLYEEVDETGPFSFKTLATLDASFAKFMGRWAWSEFKSHRFGSLYFRQGKNGGWRICKSVQKNKSASKRALNIY